MRKLLMKYDVMPLFEILFCKSIISLINVISFHYQYGLLGLHKYFVEFDIPAILIRIISYKLISFSN